MYHWLGWIFIVLGVGFIFIEVAFSHLGPVIRISMQKKKLAKAKAKLVDARLASDKQSAAKEKEGELNRAEAELAAAESGIPDIIPGLIAKLPWEVIVGFIFIYMGLCMIGAPLPIKITVGK